MLRLEFDHLMAETIGPENGLGPSDLAQIEKLLSPAHKRLKEWRGSGDALFYDVVFDPNLLQGIAEKADRVSSRFENLVVLGIGGSALGLRCLAGALLPPFWNLRDATGRGGRPRLFVCDNIDPDSFAGLLDLINVKKTCFVVISKSGRTTETAAQMFITMNRLKKVLGNTWGKNVVAITDPETGELRKLAREEKLTAFDIPPKLGGRYSVMSPVGLFPAACVGIDIEAVLSGAQEMAKRCEKESSTENPAYRIGAYHFWFDTKKGKPMSIMIPYSDALMLAADWYAQLWAESLGKEGKGQTPVKALGATDQHSQVQLYMEGPADKVFTFVGADSFRTDAQSTRIENPPQYFSYITGHDLGSILRAEQRATSSALTRAQRPNLTITLPTIDAHHMGQFFMVYEIATALAGALYGINPFDQPGVELGKKLTREILSKGK
jgi:glucose-6-phosphate isomerase